jgi:hypothetical protein
MTIILRAMIVSIALKAIRKYLSGNLVRIFLSLLLSGSVFYHGQGKPPSELINAWRWVANLRASILIPKWAV